MKNGYYTYEYWKKYNIWSSLLDGSYSVLGIQNYFDYIIKKSEAVTDNSLLRMYINKIDNRIRFKIKSRLLSPTYTKYKN